VYDEAAAVAENTAAVSLYYYDDTRIVNVMGGLMTPSVKLASDAKISQVKWTICEGQREPCCCCYVIRCWPFKWIV
jgi:hypothetical protein